MERGLTLGSPHIPGLATCPKKQMENVMMQSRKGVLFRIVMLGRQGTHVLSPGLTSGLNRARNKILGLEAHSGQPVGWVI